ncbi:MAG: glycine cleavage T C-terminal barrel domain-containing protein [Halolamina sp.]|uniref:CAF17-like 4Fe-4S cluster assembly/insertion protein YgfZ n=1 Tax=Halolamina sp. TaxID=1940283 RepID=UPI002FC34067
MTLVGGSHTDHGATFGERGGREVVEEYGRPDRAVGAVRNGVGVIEMGYGVVVVTGDDRTEFVDNAVTNNVPAVDGEGCYALLLDPQGGVETELFIYNAGERLLLFTPPDRAQPLVEEWSGKVFIQDVELREATEEFGVFGVHGPMATEKVASVLHQAGAPTGTYSFVRGSMGDAGVSVVAGDAPAGEESYEVICAAADAPEVWMTLLSRGNGAAPFGYKTFETLTLEAGTPLFESEIQGDIPNVVGLRSALDFDKGCYVGQEVVSRVENRGQPSRRLAGIGLGGETVSADDPLPDAEAAVFAGDSAVGEVTRARWSPTRSEPIALALVNWGVDDVSAVRVAGEERPAEYVDLPFVDGSDRSGRLPRY